MAEFKYAVELTHPDFPAPDVILEEYDPESIYVSGLPFWQEQQFLPKVVELFLGKMKQSELVANWRNI